MNQATKAHGLAPLSTRKMVRRSAQQVYASILALLTAEGVPFVVGGAFALKHFASIARDTKDLDIFLRREDLEHALDVLAAEGFETEVTFPHWLAKAYSGETFVDFIFNSANGLCPVDDAWFTNAPRCSLWGVPVLLCPIEEVIWTKAFVMERERFDGADIYHLIEAAGEKGEKIDWVRLLARFGDNWRVLLGHLLFYSFVYPSRREAVPAALLDELVTRAKAEGSEAGCHVCRGTLLSREQYLVDVRERGYDDARVAPVGPVSPEDIAIWTDAIGKIP